MQGKKGKASNGQLWGLSVWDTWKAVFKANDFMKRREPLTVQRTDEELAQFLVLELSDPCITAKTVKRYRADFNAGRMTAGVAPLFISTEYKESE